MYHYFGAAALPFFFDQGCITAWLVDNTNYIEHYGLRRKKIAPGQFERVGWLHAWDIADLLSNSLLIKIQRHPGDRAGLASQTAQRRSGAPERRVVNASGRPEFHTTKSEGHR